MKPSKLVLGSVCGMLVLGTALAQEKPAAAGGGDRRAQMEQRTNEMMDKLGVSAENKEKFKVVMTEQMQQMREKFQEMQGKGDVTQEQRMQAMKQIQEDTLKKLKDQKILTDEQIEKYKEMRQQAFQAGQGGRGKGKKKE
jgi:hypothetical protein